MISLFKPISEYPVIWSPFVGLCRSAIALGTLGTLIFTSTDSLFNTGAGVGQYPLCRGIEKLGLFCIGGNELRLTKLICIAILFLVISGFLPQVTGLLHFWVAYSVNTGISMPDGGDQIANNLALLLIPITLTDPRACHWLKCKTPKYIFSFRLSIAWACLIAIKAQLCILYLYSSTGKMYQTEWSEGSAIYYIFAGPFGPSGLLYTLGLWITSNPVFSLVITWGALLIELLLAFVPITSLKYRFFLYLLGSSLHFGIAIFMGLWSFQIVMLAGLALLCVPFISSVYKPGATLTLNPRMWFNSEQEMPTHAPRRSRNN